MQSVICPKFFKREHKPCLKGYCKWCGARAARKQLYKLRDGPCDWFFCNDEHAVLWCDYRHSSAEVNDLLKLLPAERKRKLGEMSIDDFVAQKSNAL